jgi:hypothetical protein
MIGSLAATLVVGAIAVPSASADYPGYPASDANLAPEMVMAPDETTAVGSMDSPTLRIWSNTNTMSTVDVQGLIRTSPATLQGVQQLLDRGYRIRIRVWGDDPVYNDLLFGPATPDMYFARGGLGFRGQFLVGNSVLDEDDSFFDNHDEIYANVRLLDPSGNTIRSGDTNSLGGYW